MHGSISPDPAECKKISKIHPVGFDAVVAWFLLSASAASAAMMHNAYMIFETRFRTLKLCRNSISG